MSQLPKSFGTSVRRKEDRRLTTGRGRYTDDVQLPRQTHAVFVRSPVAHARIGSVDTADAEQMPGVVATPEKETPRSSAQPAPQKPTRDEALRSDAQQTQLTQPDPTLADEMLLLQEPAE